MDPEATLRDAEHALTDGCLETAESRLLDYRQWRNMGGFEPHDGDQRCRGLWADLHGMKVARATMAAS